MGACQRKGLLFCIAEADACRVGIAPRDEGPQHSTAVHIEKDTVDGLDLNGRRVAVSYTHLAGQSWMPPRILRQAVPLRPDAPQALQYRSPPAAPALSLIHI